MSNQTSSSKSPVMGQIYFKEVEIEHITGADRDLASNKLNEEGIKIPRPPNAFIIYRSEQIKILKEGGAPKKPQSDISKLIGTMWKSESPEVRKWFEHQAELRKLEHAEQYPNYQYKPVRKTKSGETPVKVKAKPVRSTLESVATDMEKSEKKPRRPAPKVPRRARATSSPLSSLENSPVPPKFFDLPDLPSPLLSTVKLGSSPPYQSSIRRSPIPQPKISPSLLAQQQQHQHLDSYSMINQSSNSRHQLPLGPPGNGRGVEGNSRTVYNAREGSQSIRMDQPVTQQSLWDNYSISQSQQAAYAPEASIPRHYEMWAPPPKATYQPSMDSNQYSQYPSIPLPQIAQQDLNSSYQTYSAGFSDFVIPQTGWHRESTQWNRESYGSLYGSLYAASTYAQDLE